MLAPPVALHERPPVIGKADIHIPSKLKGFKKRVMEHIEHYDIRCTTSPLHPHNIAPRATPPRNSTPRRSPDHTIFQQPSRVRTCSARCCSGRWGIKRLLVNAVGRTANNGGNENEDMSTSASPDLKADSHIKQLLRTLNLDSSEPTLEAQSPKYLACLVFNQRTSVTSRSPQGKRDVTLALFRTVDGQRIGQNAALPCLLTNLARVPSLFLWFTAYQASPRRILAGLTVPRNPEHPSGPAHRFGASDAWRRVQICCMVSTQTMSYPRRLACRQHDSVRKPQRA
ncbi:hypothetical protein B0H14DRAFT_2718617 [Mycena olivaceomarginata]|nr:hypothetical protein B0H14DRAFT_2718617 [Mycena olivaceomarginata]